MQVHLLRIALVSIVVVIVSSLRPPEPASASVHIAEISEVMSGFNGPPKEKGNPRVQFVEVTMRASVQNFTLGAKLSAFDANGNAIDGDSTLPGTQPLVTADSTVLNHGDGVTWLLGTSAFETAAGIQADFEFPASPGLPVGAGMVCVFEAPRDHTNPSQSIDCVAYGGGAFTGSNPNSSPSEAATSGPGDCQRSLTRTVPSTLNIFGPPWALGDDANDFSLLAPTPKNNAGATGSLVAPDTDGDTAADCRDNDDDNDGVKDAVDNCRLVANADQTDADGDGAGAACDPDESVVDFDGDGCDDGDELGINVTQGGQRDPANQWDYFNPTKDGLNRVDDILAVVNQYFIDDPDPEYTTQTDRTLLGPNVWNLGPPNGQQRVDDILHAVNQYFHDC